MKVLWLRKQTQAHAEYESTENLTDIIWGIGVYAAALKPYFQDIKDSGAVRLLNNLVEVARQMKDAFASGDTDRLKNLTKQALTTKNKLAGSHEKKINDEGAKETFLRMSDAIQVLAEKLGIIHSQREEW